MLWHHHEKKSKNGGNGTFTNDRGKERSRGTSKSELNWASLTVDGFVGGSKTTELIDVPDVAKWGKKRKTAV